MTNEYILYKNQLKLMAKFIEDFTDEGMLILDPYLGLGSTV
jgi:DNA modification methylase